MPELEQKSFQKRQVAHKVRIVSLLNGKFIKDELSAGYIRFNDLNISRVNIIAAVVYKSGPENNYTNAFVDDGTGKILLRSFENNDTFSKIDVGDVILVIGRIREFNNEKYIIPEIVKKIDNIDWVNVRKLEINNISIAETGEEKNIIPPSDATDLGIYEKIYLLIKKLDNGEGAVIEEVIKNFGSDDVENKINKLLENGDIFEIKPGRLKVLE